MVCEGQLFKKKGSPLIRTWRLSGGQRSHFHSSWPAVFGSSSIIDQTGCEWLLSSSQWLNTGCEISAATTSSLFPLQLDAIYSPNPDLLSGKRKKHTHTYAYTHTHTSTLAALWIVRTELKLLLSWSFVVCSSRFFSFFVKGAILHNEQRSQAKFTLRRWLIEVLACFNASCSCAKTRDLRLSAALETFSMGFTDGFPDWSSLVGNKLFTQSGFISPQRGLKCRKHGKWNLLWITNCNASRFDSSQYAYFGRFCVLA